LAKKGKLVGGIVLVVVGVVFLLIGMTAMNSYNSNKKTLDDEKKARDALKALGLDTAAADAKISDDQKTVDSQSSTMTIFLLLGIIFLLLGVVLAVMSKRGKSEGPAPPQQ